MSYTSSIYLIFLGITFFAYYLFRPKARWIVLLIANIVFYATSGWDNLVVILVSMAASYAVAIKMGQLHERFKAQKKSGGLDKAQIKELKEQNKKERRRYLVGGLIVVLGILIVVKYTNFLLGNVYSLMHLLGMHTDDFFFNLVMPLGVSFYTFQIISYMIDVYKGKVEPQKNFLRYALYVSFFPSVVQGPIPRYGDLGKQLEQEHAFDFDNLRDGCMLILWGFAKKLILAERLNTFVNDIYGNYASYGGAILALATAAFSIQIYADFSSCMDIATGSARLFGIRLTPNFLRPYFSKTMPEFWRRWHVTLGNWFKDYVFYPVSISKFSLNLNKKSRSMFGNEAGRIISSSLPILVVWILTGIWHGPEWKYVTWGLFHGILVMLSMIFTPYNEKLVRKLHIPTDSFVFRLFQMGRTFLLCCLGRVFFRADNFTAAIGILKRIFSFKGLWQVASYRLFTHGINKANMVVVVVSMILLWMVSVLEEHLAKKDKNADVLEVFRKRNIVVRWVLIYALFLAVLIFGSYGPGYNAADFIYERF